MKKTLQTLTTGILAMVFLNACSSAPAPAPADTQAPQVLTITPQNYASPDTAIELVFNEELAGSVDRFVVQVALGEQPIEGALSLVKPNTLRFDPMQPLKPGATYKVFVDRVFDRSGNFLPQPVQWSFQTLKPQAMTPPSVHSTLPQMGVLDADIAAPVRVKFSEAMDPKSLVQAFSLKTMGIEVPGQISYEHGSHTLVFTPDAELGHGMYYTATIKSLVRDAEGNEMGQDYWFHFTTHRPEESSGADIEILRVSPEDGDGDVNTFTELCFLVDKPGASLSAKIIKGSAVMGDIEVTNNGQQFCQKATLQSGILYTVKFEAIYQGKKANRVVHFSTHGPLAIVSTNLLEGASNVSTTLDICFTLNRHKSQMQQWGLSTSQGGISAWGNSTWSPDGFTYCSVGVKLFANTAYIFNLNAKAKNGEEVLHSVQFGTAP